MLVAVGIIMLLAVAGGVWTLAMRPGALRSSVDGYDASIAAALALASTSGNGATLVFLPRTDGRGGALPGFTLDVYIGRPNADGAVHPSGMMRVAGDASVSEKTLGKPPFALFLSSTGRPTGVAAYPAIDASGHANFTTIAVQPPCPSGGLLLAFVVPAGARDTRSLPCGTSVAASAAPDASPTPGAPLLTPAALIFDWPSAPQQTVNATEWGYTHWFASATGFACSAGSAARYANVPLPYQAPHDASETSLAPPVPGGAPYAYPNSAQSMNDAPAPFPIVPSNAGGCGLDIVDAYAQHAMASVHVRGTLTASPATLAWPAPADHGERVVLLQKAEDNEALRPSVLSDTCGGIVRTHWVSQSAPSSWNDTASVQLGVDPVLAANGYNAGGACTIAIASQYAGEPPVTIAIDVAKPPQPMQSWPEQITMGAGGATLAYVQRAGLDPAELLIRALGGGIADAAATTGCKAYAYKAGTTAPDLPEPAQATALGITVDANGCYLSGGTPTANAQIALWEPSGTGKTFSVRFFTCSGSSVMEGFWTPVNPPRNVSHTGLPLTPGSAPTGAGGCNIGVTDGITAPTVDHGLTHVIVQQSCPNSGKSWLGSDGYCYDLYFWWSPCQGQSAFGSIEHFCEPPFVDDTGQDRYWTSYVAHGTSYGYSWAADGCSYSLDNAAAATQYAVWYPTAGAVEDVAGPYNATVMVDNLGHTNRSGLGVANESQAGSVPLIGPTPNPGLQRFCKGTIGPPPAH